MEQIKIGYDKTTGLYIVPNKNYCIINGSREKINTIYFNNTQVLITSIKPTSYQTYSSKTIITHYELHNGESVDILKTEDYNQKISYLRSKGWQDDYDWFFDDLEDEIRYKRFLKDWKPITKQEEIITDYEIIFIEVPVSEYEDIQPLASMEDIDSCEKALFTYQPQPRKYLADYCKSLGLRWEDNKSWGNQSQGTYSWPSHSGIEYVKINNEYLFLGEKPKFYKRQGSYKECIEKMNSDIQLIKESVDMFFKKKDKTPMTAEERGAYYRELLSIKGFVSKLEVHKKHTSDQNYIIKKINELIKQDEIK
jgi:hypothetical protein